jgi:uncharacterized LabA/DUF88 family protein
VDRCALFVDAGYVLADGAMAVHGTRNRDSVSWDYSGLLKFLSGLSLDRSGLPMLRCYWYEATVEGRRTSEHDAVADLPGLKLRLGRMRPGRRDGVETEMHRDLNTLARNGAISDAILISGEEDLAEVVAEVQDLGIRIILVHITVDGNWTISRPLRQECDDILEIGGAHLRPFVDLIPGAEPAHRADEYSAGAYPGRSLANGHGLAVGAVTHHGLPAAALPAPPPIYTAPVVADFQRAAQPPSGARPAPQDEQLPSRSQQRDLPGGAQHAEPGGAQQSQATGIQSQPGDLPGQQGGVQQGKPGSLQQGKPAELRNQPGGAHAQPAGIQGQSGDTPGQADGGLQSPPAGIHGQPGGLQSQPSGSHGQQGQLGGAQPSGTAQRGQPAGIHGQPSGLQGQPSGSHGQQGQLGGAQPSGAVQQGQPAGPQPTEPGGPQQGQPAGPQPGQPGGMPRSGGSPASFDAPSPLSAPAGSGPPQHGDDQAPRPQGTQSYPPDQFLDRMPASATDSPAGPEAGQPGGSQRHGQGGGARQYPPEQYVAGGQYQPAEQYMPPEQYPQAEQYQPAEHYPSAAAGGPYGGSAEQRQPGQFSGPQHSQHVSSALGPAFAPQGGPYSGPQPVAPQAPVPPPVAVSLADAVQAAHAEGFGFGEAVARDAPALWLEAVLARKPRMPSDLEARLLQGSALPIDSLLHDEVRHALRRGFWDALERSRR